MEKIRRKNLHDEVVDQLGERIAAGEFDGAKALPPEDVFAQALGISRNTLREAIKVLAAKGLVEPRARTGTRVLPVRRWHQLDAKVLAWRCAAIPRGDFINKLVEMRGVIEPAGAAIAAARSTDDAVEKLSAAYRRMRDASDREAWAVADASFHSAILEATDNELLMSLFGVVEESLATFLRLSAHRVKDFKYSLPSHESVLNAIRSHQPQVARDAMQRIVDDSRGNMALS